MLENVNPSFIFTNTHNTIRPCSLPPNLPLRVIEAAIAKFGGQLREELGQLMKRTDMLLNCDESINTKDFSEESHDSRYIVVTKDQCQPQAHIDSESLE